MISKSLSEPRVALGWLRHQKHDPDSFTGCVCVCGVGGCKAGQHPLAEGRGPKEPSSIEPPARLICLDSILVGHTVGRGVSSKPLWPTLFHGSFYCLLCFTITYYFGLSYQKSFQANVKIPLNKFTALSILLCFITSEQCSSQNV